ncbi:MAG TPA: DoxX family protein [Candidatus Coprenecus stercoravium]|uniref:DoxX family protein n=1 Tax=Candidatus Coprenecus stercoravium TaxID=2840735 RepID=A0A9D2GNI2_9BACT|nr:DoxX family protein [Candidatus Coprenecus stercoravium]
MRFLRVLMFLLRFIFGLTFILSGFFKLTDPVGTGLIVEEYFNTLHVGFLRPMAVPFGMMLSLIEFMIGIAVLMCVRMRAASIAGLVMMLFFTVLTFFMAVFDGIEECGCFGQAVHLTMWQTFYKNVVLLACIIPIFLFRKKFRPVAPVPAEWAFLGTYGLLALFCTVYSYYNIPPMEFGNYKVGTNLSMKLEDITDTDNFETVFVYEKDGRQEYFELDSLPGTDWTYVSSQTIYTGDERDLLFDMTLSGPDGESVTEEIVNSDRPVFIFTVYKPSDIKSGYWEKVSECMDTISHRGGRSFVAVPVVDANVDSVAVLYPGVGRVLISGDYKTLISMVRSNGGVMLVDDGIVVRKWSRWRFGPDDVAKSVEMDSEEVTARGTIAQRLFYESSILLLFLIIIIFRYVCGIVYGKRYLNSKHHVRS